MKTVRVGPVGSGLIATIHAEALKRKSVSELFAVCSRTVDRAGGNSGKADPGPLRPPPVLQTQRPEPVCRPFTGGGTADAHIKLRQRADGRREPPSPP